MEGGKFSIPRLGWEGELPGGLPEPQLGEIFDEGEIAPPKTELPHTATYGLAESKKPTGPTPSVQTNK